MGAGKKLRMSLALGTLGLSGLLGGCCLPNNNPEPEEITAYISRHKREPLELLLELAEENQTMMIGECHLHKGEKRQVADWLDELVELGGFEYLALEINRGSQTYVNQYVNGVISAYSLKQEIPSADVYMIDRAVEAGLKILCIDADDHNTDRDLKMYERLEGWLFSHKPDAKVLVYIGNRHILEGTVGRSVPNLGEYLDEYTGGRNASVWVAEPDDDSVCRGVSGILPVDAPDMIGFRTDEKPLASMLFWKDSAIPSLKIYYGEHFDAMLVIEND